MVSCSSRCQLQLLGRLSSFAYLPKGFIPSLNPNCAARYREYSRVSNRRTSPHFLLRLEAMRVLLLSPDKTQRMMKAVSAQARKP